MSTNKNLQNVSYKYAFFIIWAHGLPFIDEIIEIVSKNISFEILHIRKISNFAPSSFIYQIYSCDTYPINHLLNKTNYLRQLPPEAIIIFVRNYNPQEYLVGHAAFRGSQCQTIANTKKEIRELYNPRLNGSPTHDHVIHGSDNEPQADFIARLMGFSKGILTFENNFPLPFPFHIAPPKTFCIKSIPPSNLLATILKQNKSKVSHQLMPLHLTPHFKGITLIEDYAQYLHEFRFSFLCDYYSLSKYKKLIQADIKSILKTTPIIVRQEKENFVILDGVHRASVALHQNLRQIPAIII